ncbi:hypothetical protein BY458DRAFT_484692 [Sporodiniella umbellata]|nr:hypothetical protein BY458DRAFT_484692 [Sporodiniella umbellata]
MLALSPICTSASKNLSNVSKTLRTKKSSWSLRSFSKSKVFSHANSSSISLPLPASIKYTLPPSYDDKSHPWAFQFPNSMSDRIVLPREEEGFEKLPNYVCTLEKIAPAYVKCEQTKPGVRSTNRPWRFLYIRIFGTLVQAFKCNPKYKKSSHPVWSWSMQYAQVAVATDYIKHRHVLRLSIANGPQFLIKAYTEMEKLTWIELLESSINISSDLDYRDMPQFITLRIRHRRHMHQPDRRPFDGTLG